MGRHARHIYDDLTVHAHEQGLLCHAENPAQAAALQRGLRAGDLVRPMRGLYARKEYWAGLADDPAARHLCLARSLAIQHPTWTFCSYTAALLHGFPVGYHLLDEVHIIAT